MIPNKRPLGLILISIVVTILVSCLGVASYLWSDGVFESEEEQIAKITSAIVPDSSVVYDKDGEKIGEYYNFYHIFIPYDQIPKPMIEALLAVEDRKFFAHKGVDWRSMGRALVAIISSGHFRQGGSTITMQLVKNYLLTREKKVSRKVREIILAYYVEKNLSKERILELYLNTMFMGHGAYGVGAASQTYFGKPLQELQTNEFALLAGLFQAPSAYNPHKHPDAAIKRQRVVIDSMVAAHYISDKEAADFKKRKLEFKPWIPLNETVAPYFLSWVRQLVDEKLGDDAETINDRGLKIYTTLDSRLQLIANEAVKNANIRLDAFQASLKLKKNDRVEAGFLAVDPQNGSVLAMVGGRDFKRSQFNRAVTAKRSPGSSFKPVVYSLALEKGMAWNDLVYVSPLNVGGYKPQNHEGDDLTEVTLVKALARSMNTPVVSMTQKFGINAVRDRASAMGIRSEMPREIGISIGGFSSTMTDVARLYSVIANDGSLAETWAVSKIIDRENKVLYEIGALPPPAPVFSPETAALLRSGLQAVLTIGTGSAVSDLASVAGGKTGTSDDSRDNWFCGFTKNLVAVSWVGTDGNAAMGKAASGASLSLPTWSEFMHKAINGPRPATTWSTPDGLTAVTIDPDFGTPSDVGVSVLFKSSKLPKKSQATEDMKTIQQDQSTYRGMKVDD